MKIKISDRWRGILLGLLGVTLVVIFTFSVVNIFQINSDKEMAKLEEIKTEAQIKKDSATLRSIELATKVGQLEGQIKENTEALNSAVVSYKSSLNELKKLQENEKEYVNSTVSSDEQFKYLSDYKYKSY